MARLQGRPRHIRVTIHTHAVDGKTELTSQLVATPPFGEHIFALSGLQRHYLRRTGEAAVKYALHLPRNALC